MKKRKLYTQGFGSSDNKQQEISEVEETKLRNSNRENPLTETKFLKFLDEAALTHAATGHDHSVRKGLYNLSARNLEPQRRLSPSIRLAVQAGAASL